MTDAERLIGESLRDHLARRMSVWQFGRTPILLGAGLLIGGAVLAVVFGQALLAPVPAGTQASTSTLILSLSLGLLLIAGISLVGFGVVKLVLGMLASGRGNPISQQTLALIQAELAAGQVEVSTHTMLACCLLSDASYKPRGSGVPAGYLCLTDRGYVALLDEVLAFGFASPQQPALPTAIGSTLTLSVLPRSRRLLRLESSGQPLVPMAVLKADDLPDFSRGFQLLREDHLSDEIVAAFGSVAASARRALSQGRADAAR